MRRIITTQELNKRTFSYLGYKRCIFENGSISWYQKTFLTNIGKFRIYVQNGEIELVAIENRDDDIIPTEITIKKFKFPNRRLSELNKKFSSLVKK